MYSTIRQNGHLRCDLVQGGIQGGRKMPDDRCPEKGIALVSVLFIVCLITMAVVASAALVARATQTAIWSVERTKALYSAEAGLNHWLYEMAKGTQSGQSASEILALTVTGKANGMPYNAEITGTDSKTTTYRLVSVSSAGGRPVKVSLILQPVSGAWRHVVYSTEHHHQVIKRLTDKGYAANVDSQWTVKEDESPPVWTKNGKFTPIPTWEKGKEGYRPNLISINPAQWDPPVNAMVFDKPVEEESLSGKGSAYYKNSKIGKLTGTLNGDLYLENCEIGEIDVSVSGNIFAQDCRISTLHGSISENVIVRNSDSVLGVGRIFGNIDRSVWIESGAATRDFDSMPTIGDGQIPTNIYGSVYIRGKYASNRPATVLRITGPEVSRPGVTTIHKGVFAEDANILIEGAVDIHRKASWPAILSDGWVILNGAKNWIEVKGPVYARTNEQDSKTWGWLVEEILREYRPELLKDRDGHEQVTHMVGVIAFGDDLYGNSQPRVRVDGSIVSPGRTLLVGNVHVKYDEDIFRNPPPWFTGEAGELALIPGTWSYSYSRD